MKNIYRFVSFVIATVMSLQFASAQLKLEVKQIDATSLPQIRLRIGFTNNSLPLRQPGRATYVLKENGKPMTIDVLCPDSADHNSVVFVLDNSQALYESFLRTSLRIAASALVDSLRPDDEAAIMTQRAGAVLAQDFTTDKMRLHTVMDSISMTADGSVGFIDAAYYAIQKLSGRAGKKICILFTDGHENSSVKLISDVIRLAKTTGTMVFTVGFKCDEFSAKVLPLLATQTNGRHFTVLSSEEIATAFNTITSDILSPDCLLAYTADGCTDSIRALHLEATLNGQSAVADTLYLSPYRSDTLRLRVIAPPVVGPGGNALIFFSLEPGVHTGLELSFSFLLHYDPNLLAVNPLTSVTVGTMSQNTGAYVSMLREGVLQFVARNIRPASAIGNLIGMRMKGIPSDSSRPVILSIDSVSFEAGCPNVVFVYPDTIDVCQCTQQISAWLDKGRISVSGSELHVPVYVSGTSLSQSFEFTAWMQYDVEKLTPLRVESIKAAGTHIRLIMDIITPGIIRITGLSDTPMKDSILLDVSFRTAKVKHVDETVILLPTFKAYAHCCLSLDKDASQSIMIDGVCEQIVVRVSRASLQQSIPNPAHNTVLIPVQIFKSEDSRSVTARLVLYDENSRLVATLFDGVLETGAHQFEYDVSSLSSGKYFSVLYTDTEVHVRNLNVVR